MESIKKLLSSDCKSRIERAISEAEQKTAAEIVPMIVVNSTPTFHVFVILSLLFLYVAREVSLYLPMDAFYPVSKPFVLIFLFVLSQVIAFVLSKFNGIKRLLTRDADELMCVERRAQAEFYNSRISQTQGQTGILIFLSLQERKAIVLAGEAIAKKYDKNVWSQILEQFLKSAKSGKLTEGLVAAIHASSDLVAKDFPRQDGDKNELPDKLIIKN